MIDSIIARCLVEPAFLDALRSNPAAALAGYDLDRQTRAEFAALDLKRVRLFSGFICRVQHNHLWQWFFATRTLMANSGIDLEVFSRYRSVQRTSEWAALSRNDRVRSFVSFVRNLVPTLEQEGLSCRGLIEVLDHEFLSWEVSNEVAIAAEVRPNLPKSVHLSLSELSWSQAQRLVPQVTRPYRVQTFQTDPIQLVRELTSNNDTNAPPADSQKTLLYWPCRDGIRIVELEPLAAHLLQHCNGRRSVRTVIDRLRCAGLGEIAPRAMWSLFEDAVSLELVALSPRE